MKRVYLNRVALAVMLGGVTTVTLAWIAAIPWSASRAPRERRGAAEVGSLRIEVTIKERLGQRTESWWVRDNDPYRWRDAAQDMARSDDQIRRLAIDVSRGVQSAFPVVPGFVRLDELAGRDLAARVAATPMNHRGSLDVERVDCGWPLKAMHYDIRSHWEDWSLNSQSRPTSFSRVSAFGGAWKIRDVSATSTSPSSRWDTIALPLRLRWAGFLGNAAIFTFTWAVIFVVPSALRSALRFHRNHCPRCNYDLRGLSGCPECGWNRPTPN